MLNYDKDGDFGESNKELTKDKEIFNDVDDDFNKKN